MMLTGISQSLSTATADPDMSVQIPDFRIQVKKRSESEIENQESGIRNQESGINSIHACQRRLATKLREKCGLTAFPDFYTDT